MCGVRLERRKEQRRVRPSAGSVTCQSCGHINDSQTQFCGMCGLRVERRSGDRRTGAAPDFRANAAANAQLPTPDFPGRNVATAPADIDLLTPLPAEEIEARRAAETIFHSRPSAPSPQQTTIGGPSFLGLGQDSEPGESQYLLDDDGPSGSGRGLVFLVILSLIGGLAYMGYRSGYFGNLQASTSTVKKQAAQPIPQASPLASPSEQALAPAATLPSAASLPSPSVSSPAAPSNRDKSEDPPAATAPQPDAASAADSDSAQPLVDAGQNKPAADVAKSDKEIAPPAKKKPSMALIQAQNYLQGRGGVRQDCDQGLIYLKAATEKNDPAAAVQMGALYASGHCVQQDRVMAYRWFNSAHELDPANPWIQTNLDQLWAQMTQQERKQIAR
jgi:hypothetical protein